MCIEFQHLSCQVVVIKGLAYLLTYFIAVVIVIYLILFLQFFLENSENDSKLKDWANFGIYWKKLLSHSLPC